MSSHSARVAPGTTKLVISSNGGSRFEKGEQKAGDFTGFSRLKTINLSGNPLSKATLRRLEQYFGDGVEIIHES